MLIKRSVVGWHLRRVPLQTRSGRRLGDGFRAHSAGPVATSAEATDRDKAGENVLLLVLNAVDTVVAVGTAVGEGGGEEEDDDVVRGQ